MGKRLFLSGSRASSAACDAFDSDILDELIPFSYLKPCTNNNIIELQQREWDGYSEEKKERKKRHTRLRQN